MIWIVAGLLLIVLGVLGFRRVVRRSPRLSDKVMVRRYLLVFLILWVPGFLLFLYGLVQLLK